MMNTHRFLFLVLGDILVLALVTLAGFASHGEMQLSLVPRMLTTFLPLLAGWFLTAPLLKLFDPELSSTRRQLWRPPLAMLLAAPLASILRAAMLHSVALPLFTVILGASAALGMLIWRGIWALAHQGVGLGADLE